MTNDHHSGFIKEKIAELRTAVMYSMCSSLVKLPNDIVTFVSFDDEGHLWFLSHMPVQSLNECEQIFPARLHFFRKGYDYYVEISGKATIVSNSTSSEFSSIADVMNKKSVLIKMTMSNVEYTEPHAKTKSSLMVVAEKSYKWMMKLFALNQPFVNHIHQSH